MEHGWTIPQSVLSEPLADSSLGSFTLWRQVVFREYGKEFRTLLREFESHAQFTPAELEAYQAERIQSLINHCYENVPYYKRVMSDAFLSLPTSDMPATSRNYRYYSPNDGGQ